MKITKTFIYSILLSLTILEFNSNVFITPYKMFVISSQSMEPTYKLNSIVIIKKEDISKVQVGDVVCFKSKILKNKLVLHRVVDITDMGLVTKGDNNNKVDQEIVTKDNYVGKEIYYNENKLILLLGLSAPRKFLIRVALPLLLAFISFSAFIKKLKLKKGAF